ncbi:3-oxoacyl-ACP synthase [Pseudopedobacter sp.]|uniref:3-oxoacyl-ACP synthase n=1 Tax=Pseudopedobacter sp. TaxID=1936787 RepID=UPI003341670A
MVVDKKHIVDTGLRLLLTKEEDLKSIIFNLRASNNDTKSSMGDKYETSREMLQQEINMLERQLSEIQKQKDIFLKIRSENTDTVTLGAVVSTSIGNLFISAGIGEIKMGDQTIKAISINSPLAQNLLNKRINDTFALNGKEFTILNIY